MNVAPAPIQKPPAPVAAPGQKRLDVAYTGPVTKDETIGYIPSDTFSALIVDTATADVKVIRPQPVLQADGSPNWTQKVESLDLTPYSPWKKGAIGAAIGAGVGGALGAVAGFFTGEWVVSLGLGLGAGTAVGGAIGAGRVLRDRVTPDWELTPVVHHDFKGYDHTFIPQTTTITTGKTTTTITTGYWHYYSANVDETPVGNFMYWRPVARHSADS